MACQFCAIIVVDMCYDMSCEIDDDVSFERFVERHEKALRIYAERMVGDPKQAMKLVMEAIHVLFKNQEDVRDRDLLTSCLTILRSLCEREYRSARRPVTRL